MQAIPDPAALGLPAKFRSWRPMQVPAIQSILTSPDRFIIQAQPTGSGKSLTYVAAAILSGKRVAILTSTKALQDQLVKDFGCVGMVDIRGQNGYQCKIAPSLTCGEGPCHAGVSCNLKLGGCPYYDQLGLARKARIVVTNYAYWMTMVKYGDDGLGDFGMLMMDESHDAPACLMDFLTVELDGARFKELLKVDLPDFGQDGGEWKRWANLAKTTIAEKLSKMRGKRQDGGSANLFRDMARLRHMDRTLSAILGEVGGSSWYYCREESGLRVGFVKPFRGWAEEPLFNSVGKVVMTSATVRPKTAEMLGLIPDQYVFEDYPSTFPEGANPVYWLRTLRMNKDTTEQEMLRVWVPQIDRIISSRQDRKGIIHTHSYDRAHLIRRHSRHTDKIYINNKYNVRQIVTDFRSAPPPAVLVSPVVTTGWDFPMDACEFQIIGKLPFPSLGDGLLKERARLDRSLIDYLTMQNLVQACGRGMRSENDRCENFIIDDSMGWWLDRNTDLAPFWFIQSYKAVQVIPPAPPKLQAGAGK